MLRDYQREALNDVASKLLLPVEVEIQKNTGKLRGKQMRLHVSKTVTGNKDTSFELVVPDGTPRAEIKRLVEGALAARESGKPFAAENVVEYGFENDTTLFNVSQLDAEENTIEGTEIEWDS